MLNVQSSDAANLPANRPLSKQKRVWIAGLAALAVIAGLFLFSSRSSSSQQIGWKNYPVTTGVRALAVDKQGRVWATCLWFCVSNNNNNIMIFSDNSEPVKIPLPSELADDNGMSILTFDDQDRLWVGSPNGAVGILDTNNRWKIFKPENFRPEHYYSSTMDIVVDGHGRAWVRIEVASDVNRLVENIGVIDPTENRTTYTFTNSGLPGNNATAITMDEEGQLWAENEGAIKTLEPDGHWTTVYQDITYTTSGFAIDRQGQAWRGTDQGVILFRRDGTRQSYTLGNPKTTNDIFSIIIDQQDRVWVGAGGGLFRFDPDFGWTTYNFHDSTLSKFGGVIWALAIDRQGRVWMGTSDGLSVFDVEAALSPKALQASLISWSTIIPSVTLGLLLVIGLIFAFSRPGALKAIMIRDFFIGFLGWFAINLIFWGTVNVLESEFLKNEYAAMPQLIVIGLCIWIIYPGSNIVLLFVLSLKKPWNAMGLLSAIVVNSIGLILTAPPVTEQYYSSTITKIFLMVPFMLRNIDIGF